MENLEKLVSLQIDTLERVKKAYANYKKSPRERITAGYLETRMDTLETYWKDFKSDHEKILIVVTKEVKPTLSYFKEDLIDEFEELYFTYKGEMKTALNRLVSDTKKPDQVSKTKNDETKAKASSSDIKLPHISIPVFGGNYTDWQSFHDLFMALIHKNESLEDVQKLHYLKSSLKGDAEALLRQFSVTGENYTEAWSILKKRYDNKRFIANCVFKKFFGQKSILHESASSLKSLLDTSVECLNSLKNLGLPTSQWDAIVNYVVVSKLDPGTHKQWEILISEDNSQDLPCFERLKSFLETRFRTLEMVEPESKIYKPVKPKTFHVTGASEDKICAFCKGNHHIFNCKEFAKQSVEERYNFVQKNNLCFNCLMPNHSVFKCRQSSTCHVCKRRHHSLLHREFKKQAGDDRPVTQETTTNSKDVNKVTAHVLSEEQQPGQHILLATALVDVTSRTGQTHVFRALIDQGSEASFVAARVVESLGLKKTPINGVVSGVGEGNKVCINHLVGLHIKSRYKGDFSIDVNAYVLKSLTRSLPAREIKGFNWPQLRDVKLADPTFGVPGRIDILLGADVFGKIIDSGLLKGPGEVVAQHTHLGWILSGDTYTTPTNTQHITSLHITRMVEEDNNLLKKFWEVETEFSTTQKVRSKEEEKCEEHYINTTTRDPTGRYVVHLPLKQNIEETWKACGETKHQAITRLKQLERKFERNEDLKTEYKKVIHEYLEMGHMKKVKKENEDEAIYLAHHAVVRDDKDTTKVRVVFDASAKGTNGKSLNDTMMVGPTLQPDLRALITRWRYHKICVVSDIIKMYRQVRMTDNHADLQRIVWRDDPSENIESYQLLTVTFGTAAAPYLAVRTLAQLADDEDERYPRGAAVVKNSFYMDDLMTGHEDISEMKQICNEINNLMKAGGFQMQKWSSNSDELLKFLLKDKEDPKPVNKKEIKLDKTIKILGLTWDRNNDTFKVTVDLPEHRNPVTKRSILSDVASLFDPFGWLAPVVITAKIMIQRLWLCSLGWDDELPPELVEEWLSYREELQELQTIEIPRWIKLTSRCKEVQLHGFADASSVAYAAVVFIKVVDEHDVVHLTIVASKTKVAPLKQLTIPRLELCAAELLAKLLHETSGLWNINMEQIYAWTDSMVVLSWLQSQPSRWQVFVGNRVSNITQLIDNDRWNHVQSADNPADLASRGVPPSELANNEMWWCGPKWLKNRQIEVTKTSIPQTELEQKKSFNIILDDNPVWERFSSMSRMKRVLAQCLRFLNYKKERETYITADELNEVEERFIRYHQSLAYETEIEDLKKKETIKKRSSLISLTPFLDKKGLLRVGGRLSKANIPEDTKHPIIIPGKQHITKLLIQEAHTRTLHGGLLQTMTYIRSKYWIPALKSATRMILRNCKRCIIDNATVKQQLMGQLPIARVTPNRAFYNSGVDYAGPIQLRTSKGRGHKSTKGYICVFVCMSTRAIHLEAVTDLTSQAFIAAFKRFVARRGHCCHLWSDNGTNFVGADKELRDMFRQGKANLATEVAELLANDGTTWHFIPPKSPNFGGIWEAGVRSVKKHLARVNGTIKLTYEEMATLLAQIEACLNSRPICHSGTTHDTLDPLTPGHFLVGEPLINVPDINYEHKTMGTLSRWQFLQNRTQDFWRRWQAEYLNTLQQRHKWYDVVPSPSIGDIVIIKEDDLPPAKWLLGKIIMLHPGPDNLVRVVTVRCKGDNSLKRPLSKLILLPKQPQEDVPN